jgi:hypothetical protein
MSRKGGSRSSETGRATAQESAAGVRTATPEARIFRVETNFQQMARRPGGISRDRAIEQAETEIAEVKVEFDEWLNRELSELATAFAAARDHPHDAERLAELAGRSRQLCDVTATMRFELLYFIAASLCELLESINAEADFPVEPIVCHLDSLNLAARPSFRGLRPEQVPDLTKGLRRVAKRAST